MQQRIMPSAPPARSRPPRRVAVTHGLDRIALELQRAGLLNFRQARRAVWAVREAWKEAVARKEAVETPVGVLSIRQSASGRRRLVFDAAAAPDFEAETEPAREVEEMPPMTNPASTAQCPCCGSRWFAEHEFRQYANQFYRSTASGSMISISDPQMGRVCLCGMLFEPKRYARGRQLREEDQSFLESWQRARDYLQRQGEAEDRVEKRLRDGVNTESVQRLAARAEAAEQTIAQLQAEVKGRHLKPRRQRA